MTKTRKQSKRGASKGFTLIEMMVVIAIIASLAAFGLPKYQKAMARAKMIDAVTALASAGGQVAVICETGGGLPSVGQLAQKPNGYSVVKAKGDKCDGWILYVEPESAGLPVIAVRKKDDSSGLEFGGELTSSSGFTVDDIPAAGKKFSAVIGSVQPIPDLKPIGS